MKIKKPKVLKITLKGDDAKNFETVIKQVCNPKIGFSQTNISEKEMETIKKINDNL